MIRTLIVSMLSLALVSDALACGSTPCGESCKMHAASSTAATAKPTVGTEVKLTVSGMTCGSCAEKVTAALRGVAHVTWVSVDSTTGVASVMHDSGATNEQLVAAVNSLGKFKASVATN